ncbi:MAG: tetratricopeptide repeat protein [Planctomycetota bacterium]|nr:tetratricopeptide repeat protein [Planctomycetota bacterium]
MNRSTTSVPTHRARTPRVLGTARLALLAGALAGVLATGACGKHGKFTEKHMSAAKLRMAELKSATEYQMAHQAFLAGDLKKSLRHVTYSIELNPIIPKSHILLGRTHLEGGNVEDAAAAFQKAAELDPVNVDAAYFQGILAERLDRKEDALKHYTRALELEPTNPQHAIAASEMLISLGRIDDAERLLRNDASSFQHSAGVRQSLAHIALLRGQPEVAVTLFQEARLLAPNDSNLLESLATAQISAGQFAQAESNLAGLLRDPEYAQRRDLRRLRADCLARTDRAVEARDVYLSLSADQEGSADPEVWNHVGQLSVILKDWPRVRTAAQRLIAIDPDAAAGYVLRGLELRSRGEHRAAADSFAHAVQRERTADNLILLGMSLHSMGRDADARTCFTNALALRPNDSAATRLLAGIPNAD